MKALILNSGMGQRMKFETEHKPKCMCSLDKDYTIIKWQLDVLQKAGINDIIITTGYCKNLLIEYISSLSTKLNIVFVDNPKYQTTNYIYSMYLSKKYLNDDIILLHGDLVFELSVIIDLLNSTKSVAMVENEVNLSEKDFKAKIIDGKIKSIGIEFFGADCVTCQPAYKFKKSDFKIWLDNIESYCKKGIINVYAENALNEVTNILDLYPINLNLRLCNEVDNITDLKIVAKKFLNIY